MKQERLKRAESISKKLLSEYLISDLKELSADFGIITITEVSISNDLSYLDISVSALKNPELLTKRLWDYAHEIHGFLGKNIDFIKVPRVRFRYDMSWERSFDIYTTIQKLDRD